MYIVLPSFSAHEDTGSIRDLRRKIFTNKNRHTIPRRAHDLLILRFSFVTICRTIDMHRP